jgi:hypothetical protein
MLYRLSKLIPVPMRTTYTANGERRRSTWVQWRDHIWAHHMTSV